MKKWTKDQIIASLKKEGLTFSDFTLTHEGEYAIDDADWNYKDVPHLHYIHNLVEAIFTTMNDDIITTINVQKVLGLRLPLCVINYQSAKNEQTYYTTWLFFVLIVQTRYEAIEPNKTRVITNYNIGSPWLLKWCTPVIRFLIKRNYKDLMSGDIPMRERRGNLRKWGYTFKKDGESYSFPKTMEILKENVIPPANRSLATLAINLADVLNQDGEYFYGRDDHLGFRLVRQGNLLNVFPRMCSHEGASLDKSPCVNMSLKCPWHGRLNMALATFDLSAQHEQKVETTKLIFTLAKNTLTVLEIEKIGETVEG